MTGNLTTQTVWVTRTAPDNRETAARLQTAGFDALAIPVLEASSVESKWPIDAPDVVVFTSVNGVRYHRTKPELLNIPVFTVGDRTACAARDAGYSDVRSAAGDVHDLGRLISGEVSAGTKIVHFSARRPAGDLVGYLNESGFSATRVVVYETQVVSTGAIIAALPPLDAIDAIMIHSPRAAKVVMEALDRSPVSFTGLVCCISPAAAAPFASRSDASVQVADRPDEKAMLSLLKGSRQ